MPHFWHHIGNNLQTRQRTYAKVCFNSQAMKYFRHGIDLDWKLKYRLVVICAIEKKVSFTVSYKNYEFKNEFRGYEKWKIIRHYRKNIDSKNMATLNVIQHMYSILVRVRHFCNVFLYTYFKSFMWHRGNQWHVLIVSKLLGCLSRLLLYKLCHIIHAYLQHVTLLMVIDDDFLSHIHFISIDFFQAL